MSNPITRPQMNFYPEVLPDGQIREVWNAEKMIRDVPDHLMTPTVRHNESIYYVDELAQCTSGAYFLPKRWLIRDKALWAIGHKVKMSLVS